MVDHLVHSTHFLSQLGKQVFAKENGKNICVKEISKIREIYRWIFFRSSVCLLLESWQFTKTLKYWVGVQRRQSYLMGEGASLALVGQPF